MYCSTIQVGCVPASEIENRHRCVVQSSSNAWSHSSQLGLTISEQPIRIHGYPHIII